MSQSAEHNGTVEAGALAAPSRGDFPADRGARSGKGGLRYRLIGVDLDGTLLGPGQGVGDVERLAIASAQRAGAWVVPCTGRAWHESRSALAGIEGLTSGVFATGALVQDVQTGATLDAVEFEPGLAGALVDRLAGLSEAVLVFCVPDRAGHEYVVTGRGALTENTRWWFEETGARVVEAREWSSGQVLAHAVRVAVVSHEPCLRGLMSEVERDFAGRVELHSFGGVERSDGQLSVQLLEVFPKGVTKWRGLAHLAQQRGIADHEVAMIGDEVNDLPAMRRAGLAVAMGNAVPAVLEVAHRVSRSNSEAGVAYAIEQMLNGAW